MAIETGHGVGELSAIRPLGTVPNNLTVPLTSFVGRDAEIAAVRDLLARVRLSTLTGPGGAGKTRLALQVAARLADRFPDGIWWIDLAPLTAGEEVSNAAAAAVRAPTGPQRDALPALSRYLAGRRALLCLDNAEHVLDDVSRLAEVVLHHCPENAVLVTSREHLGVAGESVWRVPPLADDEAVTLFYDRARLVRPDLVADSASDAAVRSIATHLDGIPLALELAAAWLNTLTPQQIEGSLDDRFALLVRGPRGALRRQATLAGSIDWSHALLDESERLVFRQLSVFVGSFGLDAVGVVCADGRLPAAKILPVLARLVDKSLVTTQEHAGQTRYRLLETLRAYAAARLAEAHETGELRERHLLWAMRAAEDIESHRDDDPDGWRHAMLLDYPNFRAALDHGLAAVNPEPEPARRLAAALAWFWHLDRHGDEGLRYLRRAIDRSPQARTRLQARLLTAVALVADTAAPLDLEFDAATQAMALATEIGDEGLRALCLNLAAVGAFYTDFDAAWALSESAHQAAVAGDNTFVLGGSRALEALILHLRDQHAKAESLVTGEVCHQLRTHRGVQSAVLGFQARAALAIGAPSRAIALAEQALRLAEPLADHLRAGASRSTLAYILTFTGDLDGAQCTLEPIMAFLQGEDAFVPGAATALGELSLRYGDAKTAASWFERDARSTDRGVETYLAAQALPGLGRAQVALGRLTDAKATFDRAVAVATRLGMPAVLADAFDGQAELAATDPDGLQRALNLAHAALALRADHSLWGFVPISLETIVGIGSRVNPTLDDVRVLAAADTARDARGLPRGADGEAAHRATIERLQAALPDAYTAAWLEGSKLPLQQAVAYARRGRGTRGQPSTGWESLTRTEIEVVRLATRGLTNPEIATLLFVSRGTVKTHLSHVFAKLDVSNRTQLARLATTRLT